MVSLTTVQTSNSLISAHLPHRLIALFVGATSGIGEITLKKFAKEVPQPKAYLVGRSQIAADRIIAECITINPNGEYIFIKADVSLIRVVDKVCESIQEKEKRLNLLFLSAGMPSIDREVTAEGLHLLAVLNYYSRMRFITQLLPLLHAGPASSLRRVVCVAGGGREGPLDSTDFQGLQVPLLSLRGHLITLITLGLEVVARTAPDVSFIHDYPGTVKTPLMYQFKGFIGIVLRTVILVFGRWLCVPLEESGERHLYLATSARFPPKEGESAAVKLGEGDEVAIGTKGKAGGGVYSVGWNCESASSRVMGLLSELRNKEIVDEIWKHTDEEFQRIAEMK